jgi:hypothetical protein
MTRPPHEHDIIVFIAETEYFIVLTSLSSSMRGLDEDGGRSLCIVTE